MKYRLEEYDYQVSEWRDLFAQAVNEEQIALLPMLIKKIPSFDYAILICEGHDETTLIRNGEEIREKTMRDNVLFEIGLCVMALGPEKVILLSDESVRLPEDLSGVNGGIALPAFRFDPWNTEEMELTAKRIHEIIERTNRSIDGIHDYIEQTTDVTAPMVIGAANALAVSYMRNFVFRLIEKLDEPPIFKPEDQHIAETLISQGAWKIHILLPLLCIRKMSENSWGKILFSVRPGSNRRAFGL
ncbi:nucleotide-binding protein [Allobaculum sp. Allo2]|nr:nucleotide-binding protein [Allobaculum sp. Allo2]